MARNNKPRPAANRRVFLCDLGLAASGLMLAPGMARSAMAGDDAFPDLAALRAAHIRQGIISPDKTYRMMELSLHLPPEGRFEIDLEAVVKRARDAGAESVLFYAQDHWGYAHYPSDVGVRHPHLQGDFFGRAVAAARKEGLSPVAYYSLQVNNQAVLAHPDWAWVNRQGKKPEGRWYNPCLDTPYRDYALRMIDEICSRYDVDELFLDIFGIQFVQFHSHEQDPFCFCKYTTEAWNREHPGDDYREGFKTREGWLRRYRWHQRRSLTDMLDEALAAGRRHRPQLIVSVNGGPEVFPDEVLKKLSFLYAEPLSSASGVSLGSIVLRGWGRPNYQAGVFDLWDYVDRTSGAALRVRADAIAVQNARTFFVGESPMVSGIDDGGRGCVKRWFDLAAEAWQDVRNVDGLLEGMQPLTSSMMLYSTATQDELSAQEHPRTFRQSVLGALELLTYTGRPVESIPEFRLLPAFLSQFDTLVLPEVEVLSDGQGDLIRRWVRDGGTLVASHRCGLLDGRHRPRDNFALADVLGAAFVAEENKYTENYIESAGHRLAERLDRGTVGFAGPCLNVKPTTAKPVMRYRLPWMVEDLAKNRWYNWGPPPPGKETGGPAVTLNSFGKGQALYLAFPVFRLFGKHTRPRWIRELIPEFIRQIARPPIVELQTTPPSEFVHGTFFFDRTRRFVVAQVLNTVQLATDGEPRPVRGVAISVDDARLNVAAARMLWPRPADLPLARQDGRVVVNLPELEAYAAVCLRLGRPG